MKRLSTAREVVDFLGWDRLCEITQTDYESAKNWPSRPKKFPPDTYVVMQRVLRARGARAPARLWNMRGV